MSVLGMISTRDVPPREKLGFWEDSLWQLCGKLRTNTQVDDSFWGTIEYATIGDVRIAKLAAGRHSIDRTPSLGTHNDMGPLKVAVQVKGTSYLEQGSRKVTLSPREWCVYDTRQPYRITAPQGTEQLIAIVSRDSVMTQRIHHLDDLLARKFSGKTGMGKLALEFMVSAFNEIPLISPEAEWEIAAAISNLMRLTMLDASDIPTEVSLRQVWRDRIKSYILSHLRDPDLSIGQIASALNCTKRYVHKMFQPEGASVSEWILRTRLARCREDLRNPARSRASITEIAYSWGFNSPAHFSRAFKEAFEVSPRFFRNDAEAGDAPRRRPESDEPAVQARLVKSLVGLFPRE